MHNKWKLNLQLFADEPGGDGADGADSAGGTPTFDELLKDKAFQSEFDKRITKALDTAKAKWDTAAQEQIAKAKTEAEKLAKLSADEKMKYEQEKREADLVKREAELTRRELRAAALETLSEKGLPHELVDVIAFTDAEGTKASIEGVEKVFRAAVETGVNQRLQGDLPKGGSGVGGAGETNPWKQETYNLTEQGRLMREDAEKAKRLKLAAGVK
jgi:hypothetical protein